MPTNSKLIFDFALDSDYFPELQSLSEEDITYLKQTNKNIKDTELYDFEYHGYHHSQKVMLFAYLLGKHENLNSDDMKLLMDAAVYHDVGRTDETEDAFHGLSSSVKFDKLLKDDFYKNSENMNIIKAISEGHSREDKYKQVTFYNYDLDEDSYERYSKLYDILKDADALDRARFPKTTEASIKEEFLRSNYSKVLINFAFQINKFYRKSIDMINYDYYKEIFLNSEQENACIHGIGWDFAKLESILENGILSNFAAANQEIKLSRNFEGNNSNMWISVIDSMDVKKNGEAYNEFADNNIIFYAFCGKYHKGVLNKSEALSKGLPIKTSLYEDESFVFDKIEKEKIHSFILPKGSKEKELNSLNYLNCSHNFNVIYNNVNHYYNYISQTCSVNLEKERVEQLILDLKDKEINFGKLPEYEQRKNLDEFLKDIDLNVSNINSEVAKWMDSSFTQYFNLNEGEHPTVGMLVDDIIKRKGISHEVIEGEETIYKVNLQNVKK